MLCYYGCLTVRRYHKVIDKILNYDVAQKTPWYLLRVNTFVDGILKEIKVGALEKGLNLVKKN